MCDKLNHSIAGDVDVDNQISENRIEYNLIIEYRRQTCIHTSCFHIKVVILGVSIRYFPSKAAESFKYSLYIIPTPTPTPLHVYELSTLGAQLMFSEGDRNRLSF